MMYETLVSVFSEIWFCSDVVHNLLDSLEVESWFCKEMFAETLMIEKQNEEL